MPGRGGAGRKDYTLLREGAATEDVEDAAGKAGKPAGILRLLGLAKEETLVCGYLSLLTAPRRFHPIRMGQRAGSIQGLEAAVSSKIAVVLAGTCILGRSNAYSSQLAH